MQAQESKVVVEAELEAAESAREESLKPTELSVELLRLVGGGTGSELGPVPGW